LAHKNFVEGVNYLTPNNNSGQVVTITGSSFAAGCLRNLLLAMIQACTYH